MKTVTENITNNDKSVQGNGWLNRTVAGAGITSALGDFCYETTTVILPGFLTVLGIPAAALGIIEGIADAVASFTKMVSGYIADKLGHRKLLVLVGYGLTPLGQALIALAVGWPLILLGRAGLPRVGAGPAAFAESGAQVLRLAARAAVPVQALSRRLSATTLLTPLMGVVQAAQVAGLLYVWRNVVQVAAVVAGGLARRSRRPPARSGGGLRPGCCHGGADRAGLLV